MAKNDSVAERFDEQGPGELHREVSLDGDEVQDMKAESTGRSCLIVTIPTRDQSLLFTS